MAACVNIVPNITSVFRWQGEIQDETEFLLIAKTTRSRFGALETWLQANHPYDMPEILMVPTVAGLEAYMTWVREETRQT